MQLKDFFYGIQDFFVNVAFAPMDWLRSLQLESWFFANSINWIFMLIMAAAFTYWFSQLGIFDEDEEDHYAASHRNSDKPIEFFISEQKSSHH